MRPGGIARGRVLAVLVVVAVLAGLASGLMPARAQAEPARERAAAGSGRVTADAGELTARAFKVRYRPLSDAADIVGAVLSDDGSLTLRPRINTIVVEDRVAVLERVEALLQSFDLPPRAVDVTLSLFLGRREPDPQSPDASPSNRRGELSTEVRGMVESLGNFTKWTQYELLGSRSMSGVEGESVVANVAGDYRVDFVVDSVHETQGRVLVKFERFTLEREVLLGDGGRDVEELYTAGMVVQAHKLTLVVAASAPDSKRALFLALQVVPR